MQLWVCHPYLAAAAAACHCCRARAGGRCAWLPPRPTLRGPLASTPRCCWMRPRCPPSGEQSGRGLRQLASLNARRLCICPAGCLPDRFPRWPQLLQVQVSWRLRAICWVATLAGRMACCGERTWALRVRQTRVPRSLQPRLPASDVRLPCLLPPLRSPPAAWFPTCRCRRRPLSTPPLASR